MGRARLGWVDTGRGIAILLVALFHAANWTEAAGGHVNGFKTELSYVLSGAPMGFGELRVKYLNGSRSVQGEAGAGYSFAHQAFLLNGGVQGPYINGGVDYLFDKGWLGSIGVNTLGRVRGPKETLTCPVGYTLDNTGLCQLDPIP